MIVVDTSVWVAALRSSRSREAEVLTGLLDADEVALPIPVRTELLSGTSTADYPKLRRALSALPVVVPGEDTWKTVDAWVEQGIGRGQRFGYGDLVVGALARDIGALVWSLDADFARLERMKFVELYDPPRGAASL
jgi:predicted nucleic acid-binding protein